MKHFCCWCGKIHKGECNDLKDIVEECSKEFKKLIDKNMGSKKKIAQAARREARQTYSDVGVELKAKLGALDQVLKPKPKLVPRIIWRKCSRIFIDIDKLKKVTDDDFLNKIIKYY